MLNQFRLKISLPYLFALVFISGATFGKPLEVHTFFKSVEHQLLGNAAILEFAQGKKVAADVHQLRMPNTNLLRYGDIVALGGDFYGIPHEPISDGENFAQRVERFRNAFADLADEQPTYRCDYDFCANKVLEVIAGEAIALIGHDLHTPIPGRGVRASFNLDYYTANNFLSLAIRNWDHFLPTSMLAYEAGHAAALEQAVLARGLPTVEEQNAAMDVAYAMNAFVDHFLTDMFSSGHVRVPRRQLYEQCSSASLAGLLTHLMHDEDGSVGLTVNNKAGRTWKMFGDGTLLTPEASANRREVEWAVKVSVGEVAHAFKTGEKVPVEKFGVKNLIAEVDNILLHPTSPEMNSAPLYSLDAEGRVLARNPQNSRCSYEWTDDWGAMSQWLGYSRGGDGTDCKFNPSSVPYPFE